jgi:SPP1 gp7 family putative phage head morphogenesis protein
LIDFNPEAQFAELNPMNFAERAVRRLNDIWAEVLRIMILSRQFKADPRDALPWLRAIDEMTAELRMVGLTVGMLSPWMTPSPIAMASVDVQFLIANPGQLPKDPEEIRKLLEQLAESDRQDVIRALETVRPNAVSEWRQISEVTRYAPELAAYKWPRIEDGVKFLQSRNVVTEQEWSQLAEREKVRAVYLPGTSQGQLQKLRTDLAQSFREGESLHSFRKRLDDSITASKWEVETLFRTQTKQSYLDGVTTVLKNPRVGRRFPFVKYVATTDNRTRPSHKIWDGKIIAVDSADYAVVKGLQGEYNCRCTLIPLTARMAEREGVSEPASQ